MSILLLLIFVTAFFVLETFVSSIVEGAAWVCCVSGRVSSFVTDVSSVLSR